MASGVGPGEHGESTGIWVIHVLSATPRQIRGNAEGAVPSPDGALVAFRQSVGTPAVAVIDTNGENVRTLLTAEMTESLGKLQWSPDGKRVAVLVRRVGDPSSSIVAVDIDGGKRTELTRQENLRSFVWLPDGRLLFATQGPSQIAAVLRQLDTSGKETVLEIGSDMTVTDMSTTADGKRLVLVRGSQQSDVYVADINGKEAVGEPLRFTLDDRDDRPTGWQLDGKNVLFESNRNGSWDVFRQPLHSPAAELIAGGPDLQLGAQAAPDGKAILYWSRAEGSDQMHLMRIPIGGGPSTPLFDAPAKSRFSCGLSLRANGSCMLATIGDGKIQVREFNPADGTQRSPIEIPLTGDGTGPLTWGLASNPSRLAILSSGTLRVIDVAPAKSWQIAESTLPGKVTGIAFMGDTSDLIVTTSSTRENLVLVVTRTGVRRLATSPRQLSSPVPSPDGKELLLGVATTSSNAWLVENF